jgi:hypothetical protein
MVSHKVMFIYLFMVLASLPPQRKRDVRNMNGNLKAVNRE